MPDNTMKGIVAKVNNDGILLITKELPKGEWWNGIGECIKFIKPELTGCEVELTIQNLETRKFTFIKQLTKVQTTSTNIKPSIVQSVDMAEARRYRAMAVAYSKDMFVADKIEETDFIAMAEGIFKYIWDGKHE